VKVQSINLTIGQKEVLVPSDDGPIIAFADTDVALQLNTHFSAINEFNDEPDPDILKELFAEFPALVNMLIPYI
jgi:dimeric dUTPase (all-alpha-NTP-PPase superfamily)